MRRFARCVLLASMAWIARPGAMRRVASYDRPPGPQSAKLVPRRDAPPLLGERDRVDEVYVVNRDGSALSRLTHGTEGVR